MEEEEEGGGPGERSFGAEALEEEVEEKGVGGMEEDVGEVESPGGDPPKTELQGVGEEGRRPPVVELGVGGKGEEGGEKVLEKEAPALEPGVCDDQGKVVAQEAVPQEGKKEEKGEEWKGEGLKKGSLLHGVFSLYR